MKKECLIINGINYGRIEKIMSPAGNDNRMEYIWMKKHFVKVYVKLEAWRKSEFKDEIRMSQTSIDYLPHPKFIDFVECKETKKKYIFIERVYAKELKDEYKSFSKRKKDFIASKILDYLIILESDNLYHSDLRLWNFLVNKSGIYFIDISSIWKKKVDCIKLDIFLSFMLFLFNFYEIENELNWGGLERKKNLKLNLNNIPYDIRNLLLHYFENRKNYKSFKEIKSNFKNRKKLPNKNSNLDFRISGKDIKLVTN